jgi:hypothetical protein
LDLEHPSAKWPEVTQKDAAPKKQMAGIKVPAIMIVPTSSSEWRIPRLP